MRATSQWERIVTATGDAHPIRSARSARSVLRPPPVAGRGDCRRHRTKSGSLPIRFGTIRFKIATSLGINVAYNSIWGSTSTVARNIGDASRVGPSRAAPAQFGSAAAPAAEIRDDARGTSRIRRIDRSLSTEFEGSDAALADFFANGALLGRHPAPVLRDLGADRLRSVGGNGVPPSLPRDLDG